MSAAALYAQTQYVGPNFVGQIDLQVRPTHQATYRSLEELLGKEALFPRKVVDLPICATGTEGTIAAVNDSTTDVWGDPVLGTGGLHILAYCNGTIYTVVAK